MKIVINRCYGGFGLSKEAYNFLGIKWDGFGYKFDNHKKRSNPDLVKCVEELGSEKASGDFAKLKVVEIPDGVDYEIDEYEGMEHVAEKHRTWS